VSIDPAKLDSEVLALLPLQLIVRHRVIPLAVQHGQLVLAMVDPLDDGTLAALSEHLTLPPQPVLATDSDIDRAIQAITASEYAELAASQLLRRMPAQSADHVLSRGQKRGFVVLVAVALVALVIKPIGTIVLINIGSVFFYAAFSVYRFRLIYNAVAHHLEFPVSDEEVAALDERTLPTYTILVPLYHEAAVLPRLIASITALDYPATKLEVNMLVEEDDSETIAAFLALDPPPQFRLVTVPDGQPKTKPKACNYGLAQARGEYVVIYDAEDRPEPDQLKKIVIAFAEADADVACIQCKLNYYNREQNLLTRWFTTEYSMWFDIYMPGLDAASAPIPLGGTSNHFIVERLVELGAWDPYNVAEDADLGVRLARAGYRTAIIDSTTFEEANSDIANWVRQRSRWVKGYIQTWLVHMRHPLALLVQLGVRGFVSFQLTVAGTFVSFLMNPVYWALNTAWAFTEAGVIKELFPPLIYYAAAASLILGNFAFAYVVAAGSMRRRYFSLVKYALLSPIYWALMSVGAWKGFLQLFTKPSFWEKTIHGLDGAP
jgi:cellulose synthase/poly-beta-1,6-N-acetylglucosamine synthase-like glycosyltransferase